MTTLITFNLNATVRFLGQIFYFIRIIDNFNYTTVRLKAECYDDFGSVYYIYESAHFDINAPACAISIDGGISIGTYAIGIQISDYIKGSSVPLSTIPVKFIIQVIAASSTCNQR